MDNAIIPYLAGLTLLIGLAFGIYQLFRTRMAQRQHERSASAKANGVAPEGDAKPSVSAAQGRAP